MKREETNMLLYLICVAFTYNVYILIFIFCCYLIRVRHQFSGILTNTTEDGKPTIRQDTQN